MADVDHELTAIRFVVDSPLSSKVAMFNNHANQHIEKQSLNPFSGESGRRSPRPQFSKEEYGKPKEGSLTEARGQRANLHVYKEMLDLCEVINESGMPRAPDEPDMKFIFFGELFNIYTHISDKCVGLLLRARKHKLVHFEGEVLFQRRDDDVPVFLLKSIKDIREEINEKLNEMRRSVSPNPQPTTMLSDL